MVLAISSPPRPEQLIKKGKRRVHRIIGYYPRQPGALGYRGRMLVLLGLAWLLIGLSVMEEGALNYPRNIPHVELLPPWVRMSMWAAAGVLAICTAFRPAGRSDAWGWAALYVMPAVQVVSFAVAWIDSFLPFGSLGYARGWVPASTYLVMVLVTVVCSGWPEPIVQRNRTGG